MSNGTGQHPNAPFTPEGRRRMVACVLDRCWSVAATAERFQVDAKTVRKWRDRFLAEGDAGLWDRSSRPRRSPNRTPEAQRRRGAPVASEAPLGCGPYRVRGRPGRFDGAGDPQRFGCGTP